MITLDDFHRLTNELDEYDAQLLAVSKTQPIDQILHLYRFGQRIFGENRIEELLDKQGQLPQDIEWHFIGHIQSKKAAKLVGKVAMIHSLDRIKIANILHENAAKQSTIVNVLFQIKIAQEESKYGYPIDSLLQELEDGAYTPFKNLNICGVMGMATLTSDVRLIESEFQLLYKHFQILKDNYFSDSIAFREISMGMSQDYPIALRHGATIVRIGSTLFK